MSSGKEEMLTRIRGALGRGVTTPVPAAPSSNYAGAVRDEDKVALFRAELERVGGRVAVVQTGDDVKNYLEMLLPADAPPTVALSDDAAVEDLSLEGWLTARGVRVIASRGGTDPRGPAGSRTAEPYSSPDATTSAGQDGRALFGASIGLTAADYGIAETGTLVFAHGEGTRRLVSLLPPTHICLLDARRIAMSLGELLGRVHDEFYSRANPPQTMTFVTGPSCTADIEQTLTVGMHGPRELHVLLFPAV
jgi:L-lactate dehydrogenase complex protein LldG